MSRNAKGNETVECGGQRAGRHRAHVRQPVGFKQAADVTGGEACSQCQCGRHRHDFTRTAMVA
ncbi:hypothetical protein GCM10010211_85340 [Streptomyces albospinus]|uniref:Uncharacterized protein n=1 Tax=Streptomyces albospinus TaxID=285515 RepID=A0ABQ2VQD8_9ACTN|nr:hypothetical protein GCM10010211_85340 [Streptomyces albospinus]